MSVSHKHGLDDAWWVMALYIVVGARQPFLQFWRHSSFHRDLKQTHRVPSNSRHRGPIQQILIRGCQARYPRVCRVPAGDVPSQEGKTDVEALRSLDHYTSRMLAWKPVAPRL